MSNTPTESEFDKELFHIFGKCKPSDGKHECWFLANVSEKSLRGWEIHEMQMEAIKLVIYKQVDQLQTYKFNSSSEEKLVMLNDVKALYGGDKK